MVTTKEIQLRPMNESDITISFKIYVSTRLEEMRPSGWSEQEITDFLYSQAETQHQYYRQHYREAKFYIIEYLSIDVGRLYVDDIGPEIRIVDIALLPAYRNRGIGTILIKNLQKQGVRRKLDISIHVEKNNPAITLYKRLDFKFIKEVNDIYQFMVWKQRSATAH
ncbi:GNAT family N-acetyltransferase [Celerinatantimonas yamalensis]|uniref:GNAT family N-acetyltransferase n=1 Tax=Celerinatantimonas yamalensis TaxID=559956 RepID=A0ABW9GA11_9GAMM